MLFVNKVVFLFFVEFETQNEFAAVTGYFHQIGFTLYAWVGGVYDTNTGTQYVWNQDGNALDPDMYFMGSASVNAGRAIYMKIGFTSSASFHGALIAAYANHATYQYKALCEEYP